MLGNDGPTLKQPCVNMSSPECKYRVCLTMYTRSFRVIPQNRQTPDRAARAPEVLLHAGMIPPVAWWDASSCCMLGKGLLP